MKHETTPWTSSLLSEKIKEGLIRVEFSFLTQIQALIIYPTNEVYLTYRLVFILNFLICAYLMKLVSVMVTPHVKKHNLKNFFFGTPFLSLRTSHQSPEEARLSVLGRLLIFGPLSAGIFFFALKLPKPLSYWDVILLSPAVYFATEGVGAIGQLLFSPSGKRRFPIHRNPITSPNLAHFWGYHWNLWVQDWLRDVAHPFKHRPIYQRLFITFFFSGIFHEVMFNLPFWLLYQKSYFGTMMLYFIIQAIGVGVEKKFLRGINPWMKRCYLWAVVILPSPIFLTQPFLLFLGLSNG